MLLEIPKYFSKLTKSSILNFILISQIFLGNYYEISDITSICNIIKIYCFGFTVLMMFLCQYYISFISMFLFLSLEYFLISQRYIHMYYNAIQISDTVMGFKNVSLVPFVSFLYLLIILVLRCTAIYCRSGYISIFPPIVLKLVTSDCNHFMGSILFSSLLVRMKLLRQCFKNISVPINIVGRDEVDKNVKNIRNCLNYYKNLMDSLLHINNEIQLLLCIMLVSNVPRWIMASYQVIYFHFIEGSSSKLQYIANLSVIIETFVASCSPTIVTELIKVEVNGMKSILASHIARCTDSSIQHELQRALRYITTRPFRLSVTQIIELDLKLTFSISCLCVTYIIVAFQFTHFTETVA
ncbi:hypothetical protein SFRURICE_003482 [Spodoptera frugiperda]|nr:hypothetical protein SFRURICE_003482 [Spodoptera frugiperda]